MTSTQTHAAASTSLAALRGSRKMAPIMRRAARCAVTAGSACHGRRAADASATSGRALAANAAARPARSGWPCCGARSARDASEATTATTQERSRPTPPAPWTWPSAISSPLPRLKLQDVRLILAEAQGRKIPEDDYTEFVKFAKGIGLAHQQAYEAARRWVRRPSDCPPQTGGRVVDTSRNTEPGNDVKPRRSQSRDPT